MTLMGKFLPAYLLKPVGNKIFGNPVSRQHRRSDELQQAGFEGVFSEPPFLIVRRSHGTGSCTANVQQTVESILEIKMIRWGVSPYQSLCITLR